MPESDEPRKATQPDMFASAEDGVRAEARAGRTHFKGTRSLERLKDRIQLAVRELRRLRDENAALAQQVEALQQRASGSAEGTPVVFTEDPAQLRTRIDSFIETIDQYLAHAAEPDPEVPS